MNEQDPSPKDDPEEEPSHPWAHRDRDFDWGREQERQRREGARHRESDEERRERLRSILP